MRIVSVSIDYPTEANPRRGLFIQRRLAALAMSENVHVINPEPWFPIIRPRRPLKRPKAICQTPNVDHCPMFYIPGVLKCLDSHWVKRTVVKAVGILDKAAPIDLIDAHFGYPEGVGCVRAGVTLKKPVF